MIITSFIVIRRYTDLLESPPSEREETDPEISNQPGSSNNTEEGDEDHSFGDYISKYLK